jgi:hypothetical protein
MEMECLKRKNIKREKYCRFIFKEEIFFRPEHWSILVQFKQKIIKSIKAAII